jgi:hypothetical protein
VPAGYTRHSSLTAQYAALMATDGLRRIAEIAFHVNERTEQDEDLSRYIL